MSVYSVPDCRNYATFPNNTVTVQLTVFYTVNAHPSHTNPTDSRTAGAPQDCRVASIIPNNCRNINSYVH